MLKQLQEMKTSISNTVAIYTKMYSKQVDPVQNKTRAENRLISHKNIDKTFYFTLLIK